MKKGFTLIELLAVIVILAIILLIAIPIVQKTIQDSQKEANKASIDLYGRAADQAIERYQMKNHKNPKDFSQIRQYIEYSGNKVSCDVAEITDNATVYLADCYVGGEDDEEGQHVDYEFGKSQIGSQSKYVYMWYDGEDITGPALGDIIDPNDYSQTLPKTADYYLKFKLDYDEDDDEYAVSARYGCAVMNGERVCIKDGDFTGNTRILRDLQDNDSSLYCEFESDYAFCESDYIGLGVDNYEVYMNDGELYVYNYIDSNECDIYFNGSLECYYYGEG